MSITKKAALKFAQTANMITMSDESLGWSNKEISLETLLNEVKVFGQHVYAHQQNNVVSIDLLSGITFTLSA